MPSPAAPCHAVHFYRDPTNLSHIVSRFLAEGLTLGQPAVVVARPPLCRSIETNLEGLAIDVGASKADGRLLLLVADTVLDEFLVGGRPDPLRFRRAIDSVFDQVHQTGASSDVRIYGEMVDLLWQEGQRVAALELEELWNSLVWSYRLLLLCGYSTEGRYEPSSADDIRAFHSHDMSNTGELVAITSNRPHRRRQSADLRA